MAVAISSSSSLNVFIVGFVLLLVVPHMFLHVSCKDGFSVELTHRDSLKSHPASTPLSCLHSSIRPSALYADYLRTANPDNANSLLVSINNEDGDANPGNGNSPLVNFRDLRGASALVTSYHSHYLVSFQIGLHGHDVSVVLEVADDFIWLFCKPCPTCPKDPPIFDPLDSHGSYRKVACEDAKFKLFEEPNCDDEEMCHFSHKYNPGTANGTLSEDRVTVRSNNQGRNAVLKNIIFGCTNAIEGKYFVNSMGVLGLGSGPLSLVSQMPLVYGKKFSYCLPSNNGSSSYLYFGNAARPHGRMLSTPLDSSGPPFHKITLTGIHVGSNELSLPTADNIVISTSILTTHVHEGSLKFIRQQVMQRVTLPRTFHTGYNLCYSTTNSPRNFEMPEITLIFQNPENNAKLVLREDNAFVRVGNALCLAILSNEYTSRISVLGSLAQKDKRMLFDVDAQTLHFGHEVC